MLTSINGVFTSFDPRSMSDELFPMGKALKVCPEDASCVPVCPFDFSAYPFGAVGEKPVLPHCDPPSSVRFDSIGFNTSRPDLIDVVGSAVSACSGA